MIFKFKDYFWMV